MTFNEKLLSLRREKGFSQEQLADILNVSRQAVSKWEAGVTMPEVEKIITISDIFGVSVDYLIRDNTVDREQLKTVVTTADNTAVMEQLGEIKQYIKRQSGYEYKSKTMVFGIPLVHIKFSGHVDRLAVAKGIIAIGNIAIGALSLGGISLGLLSLGGISVGLLLALGGLAFGGVTCGGVGIGVLAFGGVAIGVYAVGGAAMASELAVGGAAIGRIAIGYAANGEYTMLLQNSNSEQIRQFILYHYPNMWSVLVWLFSITANHSLYS